MANFAKEKWEVQSSEMAQWKFKVHHYRHRVTGQGKPKVTAISVVSHKSGKWKRVGKEFAECDASRNGESKGKVDSYR